MKAISNTSDKLAWLVIDGIYYENVSAKFATFSLSCGLYLIECRIVNICGRQPIVLGTNILMWDIVTRFSMFCMISNRFCGIVLVLSVITLSSSEETDMVNKMYFVRLVRFHKTGCVWGLKNA